MSPELLAKISIWRAKANDGTLTLEEQREAVMALRGDRKIAATSGDSAKRTAKAKAAVPNADDMLGELGIK